MSRKMKKETDLVTTTKEYYDSTDADNFYHTIWGSEDIHIGIYQFPDEEIFRASNRTVREMVSMLKFIDKDTEILDLGAGYGGAARYITSTFHNHVTCLNLSEKENDRNREKNELLKLNDAISIVPGNFENIPFGDNSFDVVWSEDAILHSGEKEQVFKEVNRVLKKNGLFIFTDPMQSDNCPEGVLQPILDRIHLKELGSVRTYRDFAKNLGLKEIEIREMPEQLIHHYTNVQKQLRSQREQLNEVCSKDYLDKMDKGLMHWIEGGKKGYLNWGILLFQKTKD
jgi:sarcosine/dimethylglycine N-methyltransferase